MKPLPKGCIDLIQKSNEYKQSLASGASYAAAHFMEGEKLPQSESTFIRKKEREAAEKVFDLFVDYDATTLADKENFLNEKK